MPAKSVTTRLRVRYSETDQMGTFYNSRALEWFEVGRTEYLRQVGPSYVEMESRGVMLPLTEAHVEFLGRAVYDDELELAVTAAMQGRMRVRFDIDITRADTGKAIARGWTVHGIVDPAGKPLRPPAWFLQAIEGEQL
jgi:acyl-CoA thioester hydrolase